MEPFLTLGKQEKGKFLSSHTDGTETTDTFISHSSCRKHFTATERDACVTLRASFQDDTYGFLLTSCFALCLSCEEFFCHICEFFQSGVQALGESGKAERSGTYNPWHPWYPCE